MLASRSWACQGEDRCLHETKTMEAVGEKEKIRTKRLVQKATTQLGLLELK